MPPLVLQQRNLMRKALRILDDITTIERNFDVETVAINIKIDNLQSDYAHTMTELTMLMMPNYQQ